MVHDIPISDFSVPGGMLALKEEIETFNPGFKVQGLPKWITSQEKRQTSRHGSVVVAFPTKDQAAKAEANRLNIAGVRARVEKYHPAKPTDQCTRCQKYGHNPASCKGQEKCRFCGQNHNSKQHYCKICETKGVACQHLDVKCANCNEGHVAFDKNCDIYIALSKKTNKAKPTSSNPHDW